MVVAPRFRAGWLVFDTRGERRRYGPIPPGWDRWDERELRSLLEEADVLQSA